MKAIIFIPARYASSRYPGKPLVGIKGAGGQSKPLIQRSFEAASKVAGISSVYVTTDDERIAVECDAFGAPVVMTSSDCRNGTERCAEAIEQVDGADLVINFQGDALLTPPAFVEALIGRMREDPDVAVATPAIRLRSADVRELQAAEARGLVGGTSVVSNELGQALYFSKRLIPHLPAGSLDGEWSPVRMHVGIYAYRPDALRRYRAAAETEVERLEGLEQLRFLSLGVPATLVEVPAPPFALRELNNPEDLPLIEQTLTAIGLG